MDQSHCPLAETPIEVRAKLCMDCLISEIDRTLWDLNLRPREKHTPKARALTTRPTPREMLTNKKDETEEGDGGEASLLSSFSMSVKVACETDEY